MSAIPKPRSTKKSFKALDTTEVVVVEVLSPGVYVLPAPVVVVVVEVGFNISFSTSSVVPNASAN